MSLNWRYKWQPYQKKEREKRKSIENFLFLPWPSFNWADIRCQISRLGNRMADVTFEWSMAMPLRFTSLFTYLWWGTLKVVYINVYLCRYTSIFYLKYTFFHYRAIDKDKNLLQFRAFRLSQCCTYIYRYVKYTSVYLCWTLKLILLRYLASHYTLYIHRYVYIYIKA